MIVQSTTFPSETARQTLLYAEGETVRYETIPQNSGAWTVRVPEAETGLIFNTLMAKRRRAWNQVTGVLVPQEWETVTVAARDLASNQTFLVKLHGVWLAGRGDITLSRQAVETNWQWDFAFVYQWIEDVNVVL